MPLLKRIAAQLPDRWQTELKRHYFGRQVVKDTFVTDEPEYAILHTLIEAGDWVIDIGANIGHYTKRFSDLVGASGRVIAFEPVPETFALLAANVQLFANPNVTLVNAAASSAVDVIGMSIPQFDSGLKNFYEARLSTSGSKPDPAHGRNSLSVLTLPVDSLGLDRRITLVKIDTEGHEASVLKGMRALLTNYHPTLIVETGSKEVVEYLATFSYTPQTLAGSPNVIFRPAT
jgi:FkbM family methyltransferase